MILNCNFYSSAATWRDLVEKQTAMGFKKIEDSVQSRTDNRFVKVGWPLGGGVWVLNITLDDAHERGAGIIYNAHDMDHRCKLIEQLGGLFPGSKRLARGRFTVNLQKE
jgi:hypothetical protein